MPDGFEVFDAWRRSFVRFDPGARAATHEVELATRVALDALGNTPGEVASTLLRGGWTGTEASACACPVAVYLLAVVPGYSFRVNRSTVHVYRPAGRRDGAELDVMIACVTIPAPVSALIDAFDLGAYPELCRWAR